ncbi:hypothetical protein [Halochromatium roseum]|uniref:hypothetical protein n=1 Tax=Halochromatium roseum TaxID=391920 RepID=UPI001911F58A|nr:hypothetical protein [Halochromatium roseum]MBK5939577.1 hypothetical protein [Halochromatium roseum]
MVQGTPHQGFDAGAAEHIFIECEAEPGDEACRPILVALVLGWVASIGCSTSLLILGAAADAVTPERWIQGERARTDAGYQQRERDGTRRLFSRAA